MWRSIAQMAEELDLVEVRLDINVASIQEGYHAALRRPTASDRMECWRLDIPLFSGPHVVGRLRAVGTSSDETSSSQVVRQLSDKIEPLENEIIARSKDIQPDTSAAANELPEDSDVDQLSDPPAEPVASVES